MTDLLPCPFCGHPPTTHHPLRYGQTVVRCDNDECPAEPAVDGNNDEQAIAAWNRRAQPQGVVALVSDVHMGRYTLEWTNGPLPEGTPLYPAPVGVTEEAIERMARWLCAEDGGNPDCLCGFGEADEGRWPLWAEYSERARAALEAAVGIGR